MQKRKIEGRVVHTPEGKDAIQMKRCIHLWDPQDKKDMDLLQLVQRRIPQMTWGIKPL